MEFLKSEHKGIPITAKRGGGGGTFARLALEKPTVDTSLGATAAAAAAAARRGQENLGRTNSPRSSASRRYM